MSLEQSNSISVDTYELSRIGGADELAVLYGGTGGTNDLVFDFSSWTQDNVLEPGESAYYLLEARGLTLGGWEENVYINISMNNLDNNTNPAIPYHDNDQGSVVMSTRLGFGSLSQAPITN